MASSYHGNAPKAKLDAHSHYARLIIENHIRSKIPIEHKLNAIGKDGPGTKIRVPVKVPQDGVPTVGIIGAGAGGLYTAMILQSLGISYEILEASNRTGGRAFTYHFSDAEHDYFDVGAMRFPQINIMSRLFHLFYSKQLNSGSLNLRHKLIEYRFSSSNTFLMYNNIRKKADQLGSASDSEDVFDFKATKVPQSALDVGAETLLKNTLMKFVQGLEADLSAHPPGRKGWDELMKYDVYSTRAYMAEAMNPKYDPHTINWIETTQDSTDSYERALSESVLDYMAFGENYTDTHWSCLNGGTQELTDMMEKYIDAHAPLDTIKKNTFVSGLSMIRDESGNKVTGITVNIEGQRSKEYDQVICTIPLPVLRTLDTSNAGLSVMQNYATRLLDYGPAVKIGIKFKTAWWTTGKDKYGQPFNIEGGQSYSDRTIRTTVYPSYGLQSDCNPTTVLIASYCWTEDAHRFNALISKWPATEDRLKTLVLNDLAAVHNLEPSILFEECVKIYPWSWDGDPLTQGAFAFFGPGDFSTVYTSLSAPAAGGRLQLAGEALSVRHAWIVGALDSAWRAVHNMLLVSFPHRLHRFKELWGDDEEWQSPNFATEGKHSNLLFWHLLAELPELFEDD